LTGIKISEARAYQEQERAKEKFEIRFKEGNTE
jgi:hypothetical protein